MGRGDVGLGDAGTWDAGKWGRGTRGRGEVINKQHSNVPLNLQFTVFGG